MIDVIGLDHLVLRTNKLEAMLVFYRDVLHCPIERTLPLPIGLIQLRAGNALIDIVTLDGDLGRDGGNPPQQNGRNVDHFCLQIASFDEEKLLQYLQSHHIKVQPFAERYGAQGYGRSIYIHDPEGNIVELKPVR